MTRTDHLSDILEYDAESFTLVVPVLPVLENLESGPEKLQDRQRGVDKMTRERKNSELLNSLHEVNVLQKNR